MKKTRLLSLLAVALLFMYGVTSSQFTGTVVSVTGSITDAVTKKPAAVKLTLMDESGKKLNTTKSNANDNGSYYITGLKPGKKYFIAVSDDNYLNEKFELEVANTNKYTEISRDFLVIPLTDGAKVPIQVPPFELNKTKLRYGAEDILANIKNALVENPHLYFNISCFPDNNNNPEDNKKLTEDRAESLKNYFVSKGIDAGRITVSGSPITDPLNPPPVQKRAKGKRYIGTTYIVLKKI